MKIPTTFALLSLALLCTSAVYADSFGSGINSFNIEFVDIGDPGNTADGTSAAPDFAGSVAYSYRIGQFAISEDMINKANTLGGLGLTHDNRGANKPATSITWFEAAKFVNWLNTSEGVAAAYKFDGGGNFQLWEVGDEGYNSSNLFRNSLAKYVLPSVDEWYKAAFYNGTTDTYGAFPTTDGTAPTAVGSGTVIDTAVFSQPPAQGPADVALAGGLSPYGTMGQAGNVWEWEETEVDLVNDSISSDRGFRGGKWNSSLGSLARSFRNDVDPAISLDSLGFRVASVPEPSSLLLGVLGAVLVLVLRKALR